MGQVVNGLAKSVSEWRTATAAAESELTAGQTGVVRQLEKQVDDLLSEVEALKGEQPATAAATTPAVDSVAPHPTATARAQPAAAGPPLKPQSAGGAARRRDEYGEYQGKRNLG
jgi:hypothetical protein